MGLLSAITSGFGLLGGLIDNGNKKAAKKATAAVTEAADKNRALFEQIYNQSRGDLAPYNAAGQAGLAALTTRLGLPSGVTPAASGGTGASGPAAGSPDYTAYFNANPDLQAEYQRLESGKGADMFDSPEEYAAYHYQTFGQNEGRQLPTVAGTTPETATPAQPPMTPQQEAAQFGTRPEDLAVPTFERPQAMSAPANFSYSPQDIENDVGYRFARDEALNGVNAFSAARGKLRSGDAAKALLGRAAGVAHQWDSDYFNRALQAYNVNNDNYRFSQNRQDRNFLDDRSVGLNLWNQQQGRRDNIFSEDRGFNRSVFDQGTSNLFGLVSVGQNAAAGTANAGNIFANASATQNNNVAQTQANGALWRQGQLNNMFGSAMNLAGTFAGGGF